MANGLLSQTQVQDSPQVKDPFQMARDQFNSKQSQTVLSSTPMQSQTTPTIADQINPPSMKSVLDPLGISHSSIPMNDIGKFNLHGALKKKFGDNYLQNPDALSAIDAFDQNLKAAGSDVQKSMNESLANANRTLGALLNL